MKLTKMIEMNLCDFCQTAENCYEKCLHCGKDACYECKTVHGIEYSHAVDCGGSGDGFYCTGCDNQLSAAASPDPLHQAYRGIAALRTESNNWNADFEIRSKAAEKHLNGLLKRI